MGLNEPIDAGVFRKPEIVLYFPHLDKGEDSPCHRICDTSAIPGVPQVGDEFIYTDPDLGMDGESLVVVGRLWLIQSGKPRAVVVKLQKTDDDEECSGSGEDKANISRPTINDLAEFCQRSLKREMHVIRSLGITCMDDLLACTENDFCEVKGCGCTTARNLKIRLDAYRQRKINHQ